MRATVTGADGFVGQWLLSRLLDSGAEITGMIRSARPNLTTLGQTLAARVVWRSCDLADFDCLRELLRASKPDAIFHLAAQSSVPASIEKPVATFETNVLGTARLLEATRESSPEAMVVVVGSSDAYGAVEPKMLPLREDAALNPGNPYAASKAAAEYVALQYARSGWCRVVATRSFNHTGPGQSTAFAIASFAKQVADIKAERQAPQLHVGKLSPRRDIADVRDVVDAYVLVAQRGRSGTAYNVCTGRDYSMSEIVDVLLRIGGVQAQICEDPARVRAIDTPVLRGDPSLITKDTGWTAATPLDRTLTDMLNYYQHVAA